MKKIIRNLICCFAFVLTLCGLTMEVKAESLKISGVPSEVKVGDTFTVTISCPSGTSADINMTYDTSVLSFVSGSNAAGGNGLLDVQADGSTTVVFKATADGSGSIQASAREATDGDGNTVEVSGTSTSVKVASAVTELENNNTDNNSNNSTDNSANNSNNSNNNNNNNNNSNNNSTNNNNNNEDDEDENENKSGDNSLSSLSLSQGTISPSFKYSVTSYTATVPYDVEDITVTAKTSHSGATIESIEGNKNLKVGENTIRVVVRAENEAEAVYTIKVTRQESEEDPEAEDNEETPSESQSESESPQEGASFTIGDKVFVPAEEIPEDEEVEGFSEANITINGVEYVSLQSQDGKMVLLYLEEEG